MKYIKIYENYEPGTRLTNLKKYIVYKFPNNLIIAEVLDVFGLDYYVRKLFTAYGPDNIKNIENTIGTNKLNLTSETSEKIIYQSDDLQDVLDKIPLLFDVNKYNL